MQINNMLNNGADTLQKAGIEEYRLDAWYLLSYCTGFSKAQYYLRQNDEIQAEVLNKYMELINIRATRKPLQYITGSQEFMGLKFDVNENVLIPRQDTETLVEEALKLSAGKRVLDMCTGSGCIAVSIAKLSTRAHVEASDISKDALNTARDNARNNNTEVTFIESNLWDNIDGCYDIIVSNPPYITADEMNKLMPEVGNNEPGIALYGGPDGLDFYRAIVKQLNEHLNLDGYILFEIGCCQAEDVSCILKEAGVSDVKTIKDLAGLDRVVMGHRAVCE